MWCMPCMIMMNEDRPLAYKQCREPHLPSHLALIAEVVDMMAAAQYRPASSSYQMATSSMQNFLSNVTIKTTVIKFIS